MGRGRIFRHVPWRYQWRILVVTVVLLLLVGGLFLWDENVGILPGIRRGLWYPAVWLVLVVVVELFLAHRWLEAHRALSRRGYKWVGILGAFIVGLNLPLSALRQLPPCEEAALLPGYREDSITAFMDLVGRIARERKGSGKG